MSYIRLRLLFKSGAEREIDTPLTEGLTVEEAVEKLMDSLSNIDSGVIRPVGVGFPTYVEFCNVDVVEVIAVNGVAVRGVA